MHRLSIWGALLASVVALLVTGAGQDKCHDQKSSADTGAASAAFERLKGLVGEWEVASSGGKAQKGTTAARYHLTAGGSAVVETIFPGGEMEMVTVYHRDGDQIMLTHYCHVGNQPRMRTQKVDDGAELVFGFAGGSNLDAAQDTHMHGLRIRFVDSDHIHSEWELYRQGKFAEKYQSDLVRKK